MVKITEHELIELLKNDALNPTIVTSYYGLKPVSRKVVQERIERRKNTMKSLTNSELEALKEAEEILFAHVDYGTDSVFDNAFCELYKALRRYYKLEKRDESCQNG